MNRIDRFGIVYEKPKLLAFKEKCCSGRNKSKLTNYSAKKVH